MNRSRPPLVPPSLNTLLDKQERTVRSLFISSYIPRRCGIATFTKDLTKAINDLNPESLSQIIAVDEEPGQFTYPGEVIGRITCNKQPSYLQAATQINASSAEIVCLQHEYGLFGGGNSGPYILDLLSAIDRPIITTLHTILDNPSAEHREVLGEIVKLSDIIITQLPHAKERIAEHFGINSERIVVVPHGVTDRPRAGKVLKPKFGWSSHRVLLMSGLMSPGKGVDYVIKALPAIVEKFPETLFVVVGQTHPDILKRDGEQYREYLLQLADQLNVSKHFKLVNSYLPLDELLEYYEACDIYLTPHLDPQQVSSGTLAYALGMGKACISTPYVYARELLSQDRGVLVDFESSEQIAQATIALFSDPQAMESMETSAYQLGRTMSWPRVAQRYLNLFRLVLDVQDRVLANEPSR